MLFFHASVAVHGELIHGIFFQIVQNFPAVRFAQELGSGLQHQGFRLMLGGTADAAAGADHAFHKIRVQLAGFQQKHGFAAFVAAGAGHQADAGGILAHFLHDLQYGIGHTACAREALAEEGGFLIILLHRFDGDAFGIQQGDNLTVGERVVRGILDQLVQGFTLLGDARPDKHGHAVGILGFQIAGYSHHGRDRGGFVFLINGREVMMQHGNERRTAGGGHFPPFLPGFDPFLRFIGSGHIAAQADLHHIREARFFQGAPDRRHADFLPELAFRGRGAHGDDPLAVQDGADHVRGIDLGSDGAEGALTPISTDVCFSI